MKANRSRKKPPKPQNSKQKSNIPNSFKAFGWMLTGLVLGFMVSSLFYWQLHPQTEPTLTAQSSKKQEATPPKHKKFDFYTLLPEMQDEVQTAAEVATQPTHFIVQAGSFKQHADAKSLKAQLALLGFEASIQTVKISEQDTWYRVYLGPFSNKAKAAAQQKELEQTANLHGVLLKSSA